MSLQVSTTPQDSVSGNRGASLFPIDQWPVYVYVCRLLVDENEIRDLYHADTDAKLIAWAELYPTEEDARLKRVV